MGSGVLVGNLFFENFFEFGAFFSSDDVATAVIRSAAAGVIEEVPKGKPVVKCDFFASCNGLAGSNPDLVFVYDGVAVFIARVVGVLGDVVRVVAVDVKPFADFECPYMKVAWLVVVAVGVVKLLPELVFVEVVAYVLQNVFVFFDVIYGEEAGSVDV